MCLMLTHTDVIVLPGEGFLVPFCLTGRLGPAMSQGVGLAVVPCPGGALQCLFMIRLPRFSILGHMNYPMCAALVALSLCCPTNREIQLWRCRHVTSAHAGTAGCTTW